ncbi:MAG: hypothetical protein NZM12_13430 [Steroidobacteraceae bacterium]|nr:hypothetical protein [Steroidobacteraceae bacterium]MDW8259258.1 hypothetical protein [Gammaproteobacteria bacterium]
MNLASAFDVWLFNFWPRTEAFTLHGDGYQTLNFVPMSANLIAGVMVATLLLRTDDRPRIRCVLLTAGSICTLLALFAGTWLCPIIKGIWTPTFAAFGIGVSLLSFAALHRDSHRGWFWTFLRVLGTNSILLYTLTMYYRWRITDGWQSLAELVAVHAPLAPFAEAALVLLTLWTIAFVLYRRRFLSTFRADF